MYKSKRGFIALTTTILLSSVLLMLATSGSLRGIAGRFATLEWEDKTQSRMLADACLDTLLLAVRANPQEAGGEAVNMGNGHCIVSRGTGVNLEIFYIQAIYAHTYTNVRVGIDPTTARVTSLTEIPTYPSP